MRPIDADALRARMYHEAFETDTDMQKWDSGCWIRYKLFENCIDSAPTISPDDVRGKAHPVKIFNDPWSGRMFTTCSRCDGKISPKDCYCKHCGARMKGADDDHL